jgi:alpha-ribazole phosphatase/probable phosphoglycerate mutase
MVRHGQTEWNAQQKYQGHTDIPLNEKGREQARTIARYLLEHEKVEAIYCSDLQRGMETAQIIGQTLNLEPVKDIRFKEMSFGQWEGMTFTEVYKQYPREFDNWYRHTMDVKVPGGESLNDVLHRSLEALYEIAARHQGTVVVVSHGGLIKSLLNHLQEDHDMWGSRLETGSMVVLEWQQGRFYCRNEDI